MKRPKFVSFTILVLFTGVCCSFYPPGKTDELYNFPEIRYFPKMPRSATNPVTVKGIELGRYLFYDPILSVDSTFSCASCHKQEHAFSDGPNKFSKGPLGQVQARNTLPLFNLAWYPRLFWDGRASSPETQAFHPVREPKEMNLSWKKAAERVNRSRFYRSRITALFGEVKIDSVLIANLIAQFERTLISYNAKYDRVINADATFTTDEIEGAELVNDMTKGNCLHCHTTDADGLGTTAVFSNNGLDPLNAEKRFNDAGLGNITQNPEDNGKFKIPSLRNLLYTAPYMHDGRFETLEEVLDFYSEGLKASPTADSRLDLTHRGPRLSSYEKKKIILFLKTLSDPVFISDPAFSNPFLHTVPAQKSVRLRLDKKPNKAFRGEM